MTLSAKQSRYHLWLHFISLSRSPHFQALATVMFAICAVSDTIDFATASTIGTSVIHSRLGCCSLLCHLLPVTQLKRLQQIQNAPARAIANAAKHAHITPSMKFFHWLKVEQRIQYKIISINHNLLDKCEPSYVRNLINTKPTGKTSSSDHHCLSLTLLTSKLKLCDRSFPNSSIVSETLC